MRAGLIHIYYGEGKGKTTATLGLILRSLGWGKKICLFIFLKPKFYPLGEVKFLKRFPNLEIYRYNQVHPFFWGRRDQKRDWRILLQEVKKSFQDLEKEIRGNYDLIILDEVLNLLDLGLINKEFILEIIKNKNPKAELVLTGRKCPSYLKKLADYLIEMRSLKHPYEKKVLARKGIEY